MAYNPGHNNCGRKYSMNGSCFVLLYSYYTFQHDITAKLQAPVIHFDNQEKCSGKSDRDSDRQTDRQTHTHTHTHRQADRQTNRHTDGGIVRQTDRHRPHLKTYSQQLCCYCLEATGACAAVTEYRVVSICVAGHSSRNHQ